MKTWFDVSLPIETMYDQIEDAVKLANAGQTPYSAEQVVAIDSIMFVDSGHTGDIVTRSSRKKFFLFLNMAPIAWFSKK